MKLFKTDIFKCDWFEIFVVKLSPNYLVTLIVLRGLIYSENLSFNKPNGLKESTSMVNGKGTFFTASLLLSIFD